jgi:hypothetical protein
VVGAVGSADGRIVVAPAGALMFAAAAGPRLAAGAVAVGDPDVPVEGEVAGAGDGEVELEGTAADAGAAGAGAAAAGAGAADAGVVAAVELVAEEPASTAACGTLTPGAEPVVAGAGCWVAGAGCWVAGGATGGCEGMAGSDPPSVTTGAAASAWARPCTTPVLTEPPPAGCTAEPPYVLVMTGGRCWTTTRRTLRTATVRTTIRREEPTRFR